MISAGSSPLGELSPFVEIKLVEEKQMGSNTLAQTFVSEEHPAAMHHGSGDRMAATLLPVVLLLRMIFQ